MRLFISSLCVALAALGSTQNWTPEGKIDSREIKVERREGNVVVGTEFIHYEYRVSLRFVEKPPVGAVTTWCDDECKGNKHKEHSECDDSCDIACSTKHQVKLQGYVVTLRDNMDAMTQASAQKARGIGMPGGPSNWSSATSKALKGLEAAAKADKLEFVAGHANYHCSMTDRIYGYTVEDVQVRGEFWKVGYYMAGGVRTPINQMVDSHEGTVMTVHKTTRNVIEHTVLEKCLCFEPTKPLPPPEKKTGRVPTYSGLGWRQPDGSVVIPDPKKVKVGCYGKNLTQAEIRIENTSGQAYEVSIQPGTKLIPNEGSTQIMTCLGNQTATVAAAGVTTLWVSLQPQPSFLNLSLPINVACTEMAKKEPSEKTVFKIVAPDDPVLSRIASIEDRGFMQASIAQGRIWIYTDSATREQINKKLLPGLTDGMYLNSLYGLFKAGVDLNQPKYKSVLDPTLLAAPTASKDATYWYADFLRSADPKMGYAKKVIDALKAGLSSKAEALDARHAAYVVLALSDSESKEARQQVLDLIDKSIPDAHKAEFLKEGGLNALLNIATLGEDAEAMKAIEIAKKFPGANIKSMLEGLAFFGRESIRSAAEEAAKGM